MLTLNGINPCPISLLLFGPHTHGRDLGTNELPFPAPTHTHIHFIGLPKALASSSKLLNNVCTVSIFPGLSQFSKGVRDARGPPGGSVSEESACSTGGLGLIPGSGRPPGEGHGNPLQYSCLENPRGRGLVGYSP
ncbi:unnamed protein product [Rangifer tarandus platyrhynchus]|uniref:Uncharacterized protein n=2 Tax=Rangifer tarandus platyrhynchus TaxID=3082113 RepID=A0ABN8Z2X4_RANTA|nr:unnamed protein product [Rangifer tarandus platyrhynchus]